MKDKILKILNSGMPDEMKLRELVALNEPKPSGFDADDDINCDQAVAFQKVIDALATIEPGEAMISPALCKLLCDETRTKTMTFRNHEADLLARGE